MKSLKANGTYFISYLIALAIGVSIVSLNTPAQTFLWLNTYHTPSLDTFMALYTHMGTAFFSVFLLGFCNKKRYTPQQFVAAYYLLGGMILLAAIFLLKHYFHLPRPLGYPEISQYYKPVASAPMIYANSYPSGHTATIFFSVTAYLLINKYNRIIQFSFLLVAVSVGFSRIYVWAHFLEDVLAGSYIGMMIPLALYCFFYKKLDEQYT